jgi:hypothetical protein
MNFRINRNFSFLMQILINQVTLLVRDLALGTMLSSKFQFSTPFVELVEKGINLEVEDVLYNYINVTLMTRSQII